MQERIEKDNPRTQSTGYETKRLNNLEAIADKLKRGEYVQNRQRDLKGKPSDLTLRRDANITS